jgi:hypothetical protein
MTDQTRECPCCHARIEGLSRDRRTYQCGTEMQLIRGQWQTRRSRACRSRDREHETDELRELMGDTV